MACETCVEMIVLGSGWESEEGAGDCGQVVAKVDEAVLLRWP